METINKLLKKQAPKISRKAARAGSPGEDSDKPGVAYIRWVNNKNGSQVSVSEEIMNGPIGAVFGPPSRAPKKMVAEVA